MNKSLESAFDKINLASGEELTEIVQLIEQYGKKNKPKKSSLSSNKRQAKNTQDHRFVLNTNLKA